MQARDRGEQIKALRRPLKELPDPLPIPVLEKPFDVTIRPPGSKSLTNRALLLAALADGTSELHGALIDADDAQVMLRAIEQLGANVEIVRGSGISKSTAASGADSLDVVRITGVNGCWKVPAGQMVTLNLNNAGTATRFLTAAAMLAPAESGGIIIDGDARMRERPIAELVDLLNRLGVKTTYQGQTGFPPVHVQPPKSLGDLREHLEVATTASSQFISALLLTACWLPMGLCLHFLGPVTSYSYISMTKGLLEKVGCEVQAQCADEMRVLPFIPSRRKGKSIQGFSLTIEPDASGATYFWAAAAIMQNSRCRVPDLLFGSLQFDQHFVDVLFKANSRIDMTDAGSDVEGTDRVLPIHMDLGDMPDTAMTAAVVACFASPKADNPTATSELRGLRTLRLKETDRLAALKTELSKLGASVEIFQYAGDEGMRITPPKDFLRLLLTQEALPPIYFDTYNDHRMAMALALVGLRRPNVFIRDPGCVRKTYPTFWQDLARLYIS